MTSYANDSNAIIAPDQPTWSQSIFSFLVQKGWIRILRVFQAITFEIPTAHPDYFLNLLHEVIRTQNYNALQHLLLNDTFRSLLNVPYKGATAFDVLNSIKPGMTRVILEKELTLAELSIPENREKFNDKIDAINRYCLAVQNNWDVIMEWDALVPMEKLLQEHGAVATPVKQQTEDLFVDSNSPAPIILSTPSATPPSTPPGLGGAKNDAELVVSNEDDKDNANTIKKPTSCCCSH